MSNAQDAHLKFPLGLTAGAMTLAALLSGAVAWALVPLLVAGDPLTDRSVFYGIVFSWLAVVGSLLPVVATQRLGLMAMVHGYFLGTAGRFVFALAVITAFHLLDVASAGPMALTVVLCYLPMLAIEAGMVARHLWQLDDVGHDTSPPKHARLSMEGRV